MIEADFGERRERSVGGEMAADVGVVLVGTHHHGHGVPADQALNAALNRAIARVGDFLVGLDGVDVGRVPAQGGLHAHIGGPFHEPFEQVVGPVRPCLVDDFIQRFHPFAGFLGVQVVRRLYAWLQHNR